MKREDVPDEMIEKVARIMWVEGLCWHKDMKPAEVKSAALSAWETETELNKARFRMTARAVLAAIL